MGEIELRWDEDMGPEDLVELGLVLSANEKRTRANDQKLIADFERGAKAGEHHEVYNLDYLTDDGIVEALAKLPPAYWKVDDPYYLAKIVAKLGERALPGILALANAHLVKSAYALTRFCAADVAPHVAELFATKKSARKQCEAWLEDCAELAAPVLRELAGSKDKRAKHASAALAWLGDKAKPAKTAKEAKPGKTKQPPKTTKASGKPVARAAVDDTAYTSLDATTLATGLRADRRLGDALDALLVTPSADEVLARLSAYPHLAKRKKADIAKRGEILVENLAWNIEQAKLYFKAGEVERQLAMPNHGFFVGTAKNAIASATICWIVADDIDVRPVLGFAARAWLVGEKISPHGTQDAYWNMIAAAVLSETALDIYRAWWPLVRTTIGQPFRALCDGMLGLGSPDELEKAGAPRSGDYKVYAAGHGNALRALAALARGDVAAATKAASTIGQGYEVLAAHRAKGSADEEQFVDLAGSAAVALVTRAGGKVPVQPYVLTL